VLTDKLADIITQVNAETAIGEEFNISDNVTFQLMESQVKLSEEMVNMEKMGFAPTITGFYAYSGKIMTSGFDMNPNNVAGATMSVPIFSSGMRKHKLNKSRIELLKTETNKELVKDQLLMQESQLRYDLQSKYEQYLNQKDHVVVAKRVYESFERKFEQGVASSMNLIQANSTYLGAESSYLSSMLELLQAKVSFEKLLNKL
jgi:outer membrane protein